MVQKIFFLILYFMGVSGSAIATDVIVVGERHMIKSDIMQEDRAVSIYLPRSYKEDHKKSYPVIYLLDGDETRLLGISGMVESLSSENLESQIPEFIIVAIPSTDRTRDMTPTHTNNVFKEIVSDELDESGGAATFLSFFEQELIPFINDKYRTTSQRLIVGESYGGLFAAYILLEKPDLFSEYLIIDATYIWDNNYLNRMFDNHSFKEMKSARKVYFTFANNEAFGEMGITNLKWGRDVASKIKAIPASMIETNSKYFENETHGTVAMLSWYHGLLYFYKNSSN